MDAVISACYAKYPNYRVDRVPYEFGTGSTAERIKAQASEGGVDLVRPPCR